MNTKRLAATLLVTLACAATQVQSAAPVTAPTLPVLVALKAAEAALKACTDQGLTPTVTISDREGVAHFETRTGSGLGHLAADGPVEVKVTRLDALQGYPRPNVMKIDVEGAEVAVLQGAASLLASAKPTIFLSLHGDDLKKACLEILAGYGYTFQDIGAMETVARPRKVCP